MNCAFMPSLKRVRGILYCIGFHVAFSLSPLPDGETPHFVAHIQTPTGLRRNAKPHLAFLLDTWGPEAFQFILTLGERYG